MQDNNTKTIQISEDGKIRLQLYLARCGIASRRNAEVIILDGRVTVNGETVTALGTKVSLSDTVCVDGIQAKLQENKRYVLLNKPAGYVCSLADEKGRESAADLLKPHFSERLYNVGRLDMFSSGLIIFTNDGNFTAKISHPSSGLEKEYVIETSLPVPDSLIVKFSKGIRIENIFYKCLSAEKLSSRRVRIVLVEGKNREIRKVFDEFGIGIKSLVRVRIANLTMDGMQAGQFRELTPSEIQRIVSLCGTENASEGETE